MNIRFRKRVRLARGIYLNVGKKGVNSLSIGGPWLTLNIGRGGVYLSGSIVGSGLGFRTRLDKPANKKQGLKPIPPGNDDKAWKYPPAGSDKDAI